MAMLTEKRAKDRETMARMVEALAAKYNWSAVRCLFNNTIETRVNLCGPRGLSVGLEFEGRSLQPDNYCLAWHFDYKTDDTALLSDQFGRYQGSPINSTHRRKCTAFARGIDTLMDKLEVAMQMCIPDNSPFGNAFARPAKFIMKNHAAYHPGDAFHYMLYDEAMEPLNSRVMVPDQATNYVAMHGLTVVPHKAGVM